MIDIILEPRQIFNLSDYAAMYDFTDIRTLFQDTAFTTPVTTNGNSIRGVMNKVNPGTNNATNSALNNLYVTNSINRQSTISTGAGGVFNCGTLNVRSIFGVFRSNLTTYSAYNRLLNSQENVNPRWAPVVGSLGTSNIAIVSSIDSGAPNYTFVNSTTTRINSLANRSQINLGTRWNYFSSISNQNVNGVWYLFNSSGAGEHWNGNCAELHLLNRAATPVEIERMELYFKHKYQI